MAKLHTPDLCVIGGGAGGIAAALKARELGASVVLVEPGPLGGEALNRASLPSKALLAAARRAHNLTTASGFGIANGQPKINARGVYDHVHEVIDQVARTASPEVLAAQGIELIEASATFLDRRGIAAGEHVIRPHRFIVATGSRPHIPDIAGLAETPFFTSASIVDNPRKLTHLVIIGGGPVGLEMAQAFRRLGADVTVIEAAAPLSRSDPEVTALALAALAEEGVTLRSGTQVTSVRQRSLGIGVTIETAGATEELDASHILVAAGRVPNLEGLDIARAGIRTSASDPARPLVNAALRSTNRSIYIVGDANGLTQYSHAAAYQADIAARHALLRLPGRYDPWRVPRVLFTDPELAEIGLTEPEARRRHGDRYQVHRISLAENDRARAERQTAGLVKVIASPSGRLLGAAIVGAGAAEMISLFALAIGNGLSLHHLRSMVVPYPTLAGAILHLADEAARRADQRAWVGRLLALNRLLP